MTQHHAVKKYTIAREDGLIADTFTVVYDGRENLSHHESAPEARAAIVRYEAADRRRATT